MRAIVAVLNTVLIIIAFDVVSDLLTSTWDLNITTLAQIVCKWF